jgi:hypothetical protein
MEPKKSTKESILAGAAGIAGKADLSKIGTVQPVVAPVDPVQPSAQPTAQPATTEQKPVVQAPVVNAPVTVKSPLGEQVYGGMPVKDIVLTSFTDVQNFARDYAGLELKEVKDLVPVFHQLKEAQEKAKEADQFKQIIETQTSILNNLPPDVALIMNAAIQGEDYKTVIQKLQRKTTLDYEKPFESQDPVRMVNLYTNKSHTKETFDALDETVKDTLLDAVKLKFDTDRNDLVNFEANTKKATEERQKRFSASVESSIAKMILSNPTMGKAEIDRVRQIMLYGIGDVLFTKEKTYSPDAAEKVALMEYGKAAITAQSQTIGELVARMSNQAVSDETAKLLMKSDKPQQHAAPTGTNIISQLVEQATSFVKKK